VPFFVKIEGSCAQGFTFLGTYSFHEAFGAHFRVRAYEASIAASQCIPVLSFSLYCGLACRRALILSLLFLCTTALPKQLVIFLSGCEYARGLKCNALCIHVFVMYIASACNHLSHPWERARALPHVFPGSLQGQCMSVHEPLICLEVSVPHLAREHRTA